MTRQEGKRSILVTGGAGYIGSHTCKVLARKGYLPVTYDNLSSGHRELVKWGPLETGDILDWKRLSEVLRRYQPAVVIHFAALIEAGESVVNPGLYHWNNVEGTFSLLEQMRVHEISRLVFSSTAAVYGKPAKTPIPEDHPLAPINPYGETKLRVERMLEDRRTKGVLDSVVLRYFNAAGADPEGEAGELHQPESHLLPNVLDAALGKKPALRINGGDYPTPDGTCIRDYIHVSDLADAHVLALEELLSEKEGGVYNLGSGKGHSVLEVVKAVEGITGKPVPVEVGPRRPGDSPILVADASRAEAALKWKAVNSDLATIVRTAWEWLGAKRI